MDDITSEFLREIESHTMIISVCVTRCFGITKDPESNNFMMVMEYAKNGLCQPANVKSSQNEYEKQVYGVLPYVAPEVLRGKEYTQESDIYGLGIGKYSESIEAIDFTKLNLDKDN
ncbi:unnamed protein product [Rhizophagus irregularis]|nr:unnamed protein product [Rhizophagus irregularis]